MRCQTWRHEWACRVKDAQKLSGKTMCSWEISKASHASFRIIWSVFGLWWNWNHCMRMSLPALLAEICSPEIAEIPGSFLDQVTQLVIFDHRKHSGERSQIWRFRRFLPKAWCHSVSTVSKGEDVPFAPWNSFAKQTIYAQAIISELKTSWWVPECCLQKVFVVIVGDS